VRLRPCPVCVVTVVVAVAVAVVVAVVVTVAVVLRFRSSSPHYASYLSGIVCILPSDRLRNQFKSLEDLYIEGVYMR